MILRSQRLQEKMPRKNKEDSNPITYNIEDEHSESQASESEDEKTIVENPSVTDLQEEIRSLKKSLQMLMEKANSQPTEVAAPHLQKVVELPHSTAAGNLFIPPNNSTIQSSYQPIQKISIDKISLPTSFIPNVSLPYYVHSHMPPHTVQSFVPLPSVQNNFMSSPFVQNYMPVQSTQNCMPNQSAPSLMSTSSYQTLNAPSTFVTPAAVPSFTNTQTIREHRPIRQLYDLPEFTGRPEQWPMFSVSYKESTQHYGYTNLENLSRLQKALKGDAKAKVEAYLIHPENVDQIMTTLEFHYGRPQILVRSQISRVRAFPSIPGNRTYEIINFSSMVSNLTVFLQNAGATPHLCNPTLLEELVNKLPIAKREEWVKYSINNFGQYPTVRDFSVWLQEVATYISLATELDGNRNDASINKRDKMRSSFAITTNQTRQPNCLKCKQNHHLNQCTKFKNMSIAERWKFVKDNHLCFSCLHNGHNTLNCNNRRQCGLMRCTKYHNRLLHENKNFNNSNENVQCQNNSDGTLRNNSDGTLVKGIRDDNKDNTPVTTIVGTYLSKKTLFKYLPVQLKGPSGSVNVIAFIDDGSKISLLEEKVARQIGLNGPKSNLSLGWIGGKTSKEISTKINLEIGSMTGDIACDLPMRNVRTTRNLQLPPQSLHINKFKRKYPVLSNILIDDYIDAIPKLLIGLPHMTLVRPLNVINLDENFSVHQTKLGNILFGSNEESGEATVCVIDFENLDDIQKKVSEYFTLESFGMKAVEPVVSEDDKRAEEILENTTKKRGFHFETGLLWKKNNFIFKESYGVALRRLRGVESKMQKDEDMANWYKEKIDEYVSKSYARKLSPEEAKIENDRTWYLPHFVITNVNKGNKRRLVFDAAALVEGESFNSRLLKGPVRYRPKPLLAILFKFRQCRIGVCADIREMFHRIRIREEDQTAQRFLWRDGDSSRSPDVYVMQAMIFGSASSPCSAQYVKNLNAKLYCEPESRTYRAIVECHYVDDYVDSFDTVSEAVAVTSETIAVHARAGFELRGFISNSANFLHSISGEDAVYNDLNLTTLNGGETTTEKVLGLFWSPVDDTFRFELKFARVPEAVLNGSRRPTKSEVLSLTMSIFDPFGFLANMVIRSKIFLQELWRHNTEWNSPIAEEVYGRWYTWYRELENVHYIKIPRCYDSYFSNSLATVDLHIFVDASEVAFAAVGYWRICYQGNVRITFIAGKSKCAPIKRLSIPRLELLAAVLGARLKDAIVDSHDKEPRKIEFWSDSKTVIKWIQSNTRAYKQFVAHRIAEILEISEVRQWRWVPGANNPADDATRPQCFSESCSKSRWLNGPEFLKSDVSEWPKLPDDIDEYEVDSEMRSKYLMAIIDAGPLIQYDEKSKYYALLRVRCWLMRAVEIFKCYASGRKKSELNFRQYLTVQEIEEAENFWCRSAQNDEFAEEYDSLKSNKPICNKSPIFKLTPFLGQDGLIRISGRIDNAECVSRKTREPIIMPKKHIITKLIVKHYHEEFRHQNQEAICAAIRVKFWIPCLRQLVRYVKNNCQECKNRNVVPKPPLMGQLPMDRLTPFVRPFTYTGVDYIGPFTVSIGRRGEKRWVALFTCLTVRAIHLEMAKDLSTDAVILCIRNFINRRGVPVRIRSDRGTNFIGACKEEFVLDEVKLADECVKRRIEWVFNTPANPSAGGAWERMVRSVKSVLSFTLREKSPQIETLNSLLIEAENLVNSRPLTHLPIESAEAEPLTPNHFLLGCPNIVQTPAVGERVVLRKQWHILQQLKQTFWKRWVLEYLPDLTRRTKWYLRTKPLQVGDVVIICDDNEARGEWKKGIVKEVFMAADGQVRSAVVKTSVGNLRRPSSKLAVLDVGCESPGSTHGWRNVVN